MSISVNIRRQRDRKKMSQRLLADLVGVSQATISNWESECTGPSSEEIKKLAEVFEISISQLLPDSISSKVIQQDRNSSHNNNQPIHYTTQSVMYEELLLAQKELIQIQKARIIALETENECLKSLQRN